MALPVFQLPSAAMLPTILMVWPYLVVLSSLKVTETEVAGVQAELVLEVEVEVILAVDVDVDVDVVFDVIVDVVVDFVGDVDVDVDVDVNADVDVDVDVDVDFDVDVVVDVVLAAFELADPDPAVSCPHDTLSFCRR